MRSVLRLLVLTLLLCSFVFAQTTGNIYGKVTDSSGAPLPNVKVTLTSPALINSQVEVTAAAGLFQFPTLPIGTYKVTFEGAGFSTAVRSGVELTAGFTADVNMAMVKGAQGTTVVSDHAQMVNQRDTNVQANVQASQLANVGASRDIWSIMALTPGSQIVGTVDVGGNQAGSQRSTYNYGYQEAQSRKQLDGVNTTEGTSSAGMYYDYGSVAEMRQTTAANDASMPVPGTFLNTIIKQGGDVMHGGLYVDYENSSFQGHNINNSQLEAGSGIGTRVLRYQDYNADLGGKIIKNRLWYYISIRDQLLGSSVTGFPAENPSAPANNPNSVQNATEKITLKINKNNRLTHFATLNGKDYPYRGEAANYWTDGTYEQRAPSFAGNLRHEGTITRKLFVTNMVAMWGYNWTNHGWPAQNCSMIPSTSAVPCVNGQDTPRRYENQTTNNEGTYPGYYLRRRRWIADTNGKYFAERILGTPMNFTFGYTWERESYNSQNQGPMGQTYYWFNSPAGSPDFTTPYEIQILNGPTRTMDVERHQGAYVSDQIKVGRRAILTMGVRWDSYRNYEPAEAVRTDAPYRDFYYAGAPLPNGYSIPAQNASMQFAARQILSFPVHFSPRIGLAYDITGKANFILKMSYGRFYINPSASFGTTYNPIAYIGGGTAGTPTSGTGMTFKWSDPTLAPFNWNQVGAFVNGSLPSSVTLDPNLKLPFQDEGTIFLERQFTKTFSMRAGFVFRYQQHDIYQKDLGRPYSLYTQPITVYDNGPDGLKGTADDRGNITVCCDIPTGTKLPVSQLQATNSPTPDEYFGGDLSFTKRMSHHWMLSGGFSWSASHILYQGTTATAAPNNPLQAWNNAARVSYWGSNFRGSYQAPLGIVISPAVRLMQGQPIDRLLSLTGLNVGSYNLIVDPYGTYRYDNVYVVDTRVEKRLKFREKYNLGIFFDAYNLTNGNARVTYSNTTGIKTVTLPASQFPTLAGTYKTPLFGSPTSIVGPRVFRLGVKFSF